MVATEFFAGGCDILRAFTAANVLDLCKITWLQQEREMRLTPTDRNVIGGDVLLWEMRSDATGHVLSQVGRAFRFKTLNEDLQLFPEALLN
jgi:hypothetical protein